METANWPGACQLQGGWYVVEPADAQWHKSVKKQQELLASPALVLSTLIWGFRLAAKAVQIFLHPSDP